MDLFKLADMKGGWLAGNFSPSALVTDQFEVAVKEYRAGEEHAWHYHKVATEITIVLSGRISMCDRVLTKGDIIRLDPNEGTAFKALTDAVTVVLKAPSVKGDKYEKPR